MARAVAAASLKLHKPFITHISPPQSLTKTTILSFTTFHKTPQISSKKKHNNNNPKPTTALSSASASPVAASASSSSASKEKAKRKGALEVEKRRTRSEKPFSLEECIDRYGIDRNSHFPVLLGELLDVFSSFRLRSFVDCTLGAGGHSSAESVLVYCPDYIGVNYRIIAPMLGSIQLYLDWVIIQAHPELQTYIGLDVDPIAHEKAQCRINNVVQVMRLDSVSDLKAHFLYKNFKEIKQVIGQVDEKLLSAGVDGILMDLGMSSMQVNDAGRGFSLLNNGPLDMRMDPEASLKAEDILNSWPATEVGRILRDYGEESNWYYLQNKIVKARLEGGLHSTDDLANLIRGSTSMAKGGRQGWIKTAARVFQALRIAVNDELKTLEQSLYSCFDCLSPGGRLAVISFHSLEDRIVKQTFLDIINNTQTLGEENDLEGGPEPTQEAYDLEKENWIKQVVKGSAGVILTKRPITASIEEERLNSRCRSAKLRVIQKF